MSLENSLQTATHKWGDKWGASGVRPGGRFHKVRGFEFGWCGTAHCPLDISSVNRLFPEDPLLNDSGEFTVSENDWHPYFGLFVLNYGCDGVRFLLAHKLNCLVFQF